MPTNEMATEPDDASLMSRLAAGDDLALNTLMDRWSPRVISFLTKMTGSRDVAIDLSQETFVRLFGARTRYRPGGVFSTYLFSIAANLARNHYRWMKRHPTVSLDAGKDESSTWMPETADPQPAPDERARSSEKYREVSDALLALPHDIREAMSLFVYQGLGYAEIAMISHCSQKAVETRIYRARQILKERLKDLR